MRHGVARCGPSRVVFDGGPCRSLKLFFALAEALNLTDLPFLDFFDFDEAVLSLLPDDFDFTSPPDFAEALA